MEIKLFKFTPVYVAALATAASFYGLSVLYKPGLTQEEIRTRIFLICAIVFILICALSFARSVALFPKASLQKRRTRELHIFAVFFAAGCMLGLSQRISAFKKSMPYSGIPFENVSAISGSLQDDPRATGGSTAGQNTRGMANVRLDYVLGKHGEKAGAKGTTLVFFGDGVVPRLKEFGRGAQVYIEGGFLENRTTKTTSGELFRARAAHVMRPSGFLNQVRTKIRIAVIDIFSSGDAGRGWGGLSLALLLGIRDNLDTALSAQYRDAGSSYILALSGMHLSIVSLVIAFLLKRPLGLKKASFAGAVFIVCYVYIVGASPSLQRAAIMYLVGAAAIITGKSISGIYLLGISFLVQLVIDSSGADSVSFILSYAALAGILTLSQMALGLLRGKLPIVILSPLTASFGAFLATMAITTGFFHSLRPIGIFCGLLLVPITTVFMGGSMAYLALSPIFAFFSPLRKLFELILGPIYFILDKITLFAAKFPGLDTENTGAVVIINFAIVLLLYLAWKLHMPRKLRLAAF
jgi:competence protein ComEC